MAATTKRTKADADVPATDPMEEPVIWTGDDSHSGWEHDWRNPDAKFDRSDTCPNALLRRLAPR